MCIRIMKKISLDSLEEKRKALCMNYARKCSESENERSNDIFKKTEKIHRMITINEEIYDVKYAKTEKYAKTSEFR